MQVITTHTHADFDGLASMIAVQKLYPNAILAFSGSQKKNLRRFISQILPYKYDIQQGNNVDLKKITKLIIVDTRISDRIGRFAACLDNENVEIHLFDHHPFGPGDIKGDVENIEDVGSTTTVLTQLLQKKQIAITPEEATIMALGIYEDTGTLTHLSTTPADLRAAAWLVEQGAKLDIIPQFMSHDLTKDQTDLLHELMKTAQKHIIRNTPVVLVTHTREEYSDDFALIVRRLIVMENLDALFALISMAGKTYLLARSRTADVNVGAIARDLGGGGHASVASATMQHTSLAEAEAKLVQALHRHISPYPIASEMMSHPAITIPVNATIHHANDLLTRYNVTAMPVTINQKSSDHSSHNEQICGIISRMIIEKAIHHDLGDLPVSEYMATDIKTLSPDATLSEIQELIIKHHQRLIPIVKDNQIKGIITRTDLLNLLISDPTHLPQTQLNEAELPSLERSRNLSTLIDENLDEKLISLFKEIGKAAADLSFEAYAVGGIVRDLLLKKKNLDLDVVIEGDGIIFAKELASRLHGKVITHEHFNTAMVIMKDGFKIDVATARLEYYEHPAAIPSVELSSIKLDLSRRDFTINAMAIHLNPKHFGTLIDFFNCQNDLKNKSLKVLHNLSFVEDPTRIFRAIRLEQRMGFKIAEHTRKLINGAVKLKLFGKGHNYRFFNELQIILSEENPIPIIHRMAEFDLFQFIWPDLKPSREIDETFTEILNHAYGAISWFKKSYPAEKVEYWTIYLLAIMARCQIEDLQNFCTRFSLPHKLRKKLLDHKSQVDEVAASFPVDPDVLSSEKYQILSKISNEGLLYLMAIAPNDETRKFVSYHITDLKKLRPRLSGKDLRKLGYQVGPIFKEILSTLRYARMDGITTSIEDEISFLKTRFPIK